MTEARIKLDYWFIEGGGIEQTVVKKIDLGCNSLRFSKGEIEGNITACGKLHRKSSGILCLILDVKKMLTDTRTGGWV